MPAIIVDTKLFECNSWQKVGKILVGLILAPKLSFLPNAMVRFNAISCDLLSVSFFWKNP